MSRPRPIRAATVAALAALSLVLPAAAVAAPPVAPVDEPAAAIRDYWTPARMRDAEPLRAEAPAAAAPAPAPPAAPGGEPTYVPPASASAPADAAIEPGTTAGRAAAASAATPVAHPSAAAVRMHGKVFFTLPKLPPRRNRFVCSGTAVNSANRSLVITAGHCIYDWERGGGMVANLLFVPAYDHGRAPYGKWAARRVATTRQWKRKKNLHFDLGAAVVRRVHGRRLQSVVGASGIGFDQPREQTYDILGYPAQPPFNGEAEQRCTSRYRGADFPRGGGPTTMGATCNMTAGSSGGGWMAGDTLLSVVSYGYGANPTLLYGPYLSRTAKRLYRRVSG